MSNWYAEDQRQKAAAFNQALQQQNALGNSLDKLGYGLTNVAGLQYYIKTCGTTTNDNFTLASVDFGESPKARRGNTPEEWLRHRVEEISWYGDRL